MNTPEPPDLPPWLEEHLVSDSDLAQAYEGAAPALRAACKHTLAVQHVFFGESADREEQRLTRRAHGVDAQACIRPADWALVVVAADYASAPRLLAALMPALLARVPLTLCVCTPGPARPELLCALELAGQERLYALDAPGSLELVRGLAARPGQGRLVLLHRGALSALRALADEAELPCWEERRAPVLRICDAKSDAALIRLAHPDSTIHAPPGSGAVADAVYGSGRDAARFRAPLALPPGMEGCWLHPSLTPDFFRVRTLAFHASPARCGSGGRA